MSDSEASDALRRDPPPAAANPPVRRRRHHRSSPTRGRSRSPPRRRSRSRPRRSPPCVLLVLLPRGGANGRQEMEWKRVFRELPDQFLLYDTLYPFRLAAETILRQNRQYHDRSAFQKESVDHLAQSLFGTVAQRFDDKRFELNYFQDWWLEQKALRAGVIVLGSGDAVSWPYMCERLRREHGARTVGPPQSGADVVIHSTAELERFLKNVRRSSLE